VPDAQTVALRPLNDAHSSVLTSQLLGTDPSVSQLAAEVASRAAGNPFFIEEIVRDLAERGVLRGQPGAYRLCGDGAVVSVPATLQAAIGARIDRLGSTANAQRAIDRLAAAPADPGFVVHEIALLRMQAVLARAKGADADYREFRDRYRKMANDLGFEGHMAWAEAMS
jgi:hypothetical protein